MCIFLTALLLAPFTILKRTQTDFPEQQHVSFQSDEFPAEWKMVWSAYFTDDVEFDDFINYFLDTACKAPQRLAVEEQPSQLFVCAKPCKSNQVPVIKFTLDGRRIRSCQRIAPPSVGKTMEKKKKKTKTVV